MQLVQTAAESFLDADQNGIRVSGGENLDFLDGEVNGTVHDLVIQGAKLGLQGFQLVADFGKAGFKGNDSINRFCLFQKRP